MNEKYSIGSKYHFVMETELLGDLSIDGTVIYNDGRDAVVRVHLMNGELDSYAFPAESVKGFIPGFDDPEPEYAPFQFYVCIDADSGDFTYSYDLETGDVTCHREK